MMKGPQRRIVVTGIGLVTPLGTTAPATFSKLLKGQSGLVPLHKVPYFLPSYLADDKRLPTAEKASMLAALADAMPCKVAGAVIEDGEYGYYYDYERKENVQRRKALQFAPTAHEPRGFRFCTRAVEEALQDALLLHPASVERSLKANKSSCSSPENGKEGALATESPLIGINDPRRVGVNIGMGIPSLSDVTDVASYLTGELSPPSSPSLDGAAGHRVQYSKIHPFFVPKILGNMAAGVTAIKYNCQGFVSSSVAACATGAHCIGESFLFLQHSPAAKEIEAKAKTRRAFGKFLSRSANAATASGTAVEETAANHESDGGSTDGGVDVMICGATEACITPVSVGGFARMRALSTQCNEKTNKTKEETADAKDKLSPSTASRPFDVTRDGFVMAEGAGILILEEYEHAKQRIAGYLKSIEENVSLDAELRTAFASKSVENFIYGEVRGFGVSCDAHHVAAPHPQGRGAEACLRNCLSAAGVLKDENRANAFYTTASTATRKSTDTTGIDESSSDGNTEEFSFTPLRIGYLNAHATGTIGDDIELGAVRRVFGRNSFENENEQEAIGPLYVSSTKASLGHMLGAAGSVEAAIALLSLKHGAAPPTAHLTSPAFPVELQEKEGIRLNTTAVPLDGCEAVVSTSFGFGGINTALLFTSTAAAGGKRDA